MKTTPILKTIAGLTAALFTSTTVLWAAPAITPSMTRPSHTEVNFHSLVQQIDLPEIMGSVDARHVEEGVSTIIHIQDAHGSFQAQENIKALLEELTKSHDVDTIFVEGASEVVTPEHFKFFKDKAANDKLVEGLVKDSLMGGPEWFVYENDTKAYGVEDMGLYYENLKHYRSVLKYRDKAESFLTTYKSEIMSAGSKIFNKKLKSFLREWMFYHDKPEELMRHFSVLSQYAQSELDLDLSNARRQVNWPQLVRIAKLKGLEADLDSARSKEEFNVLTEWAKQNKISESLLHANADRTQVESFYQAAEVNGFTFEDYPNLSKQWAFSILRSEMNATDLMQELQTLTQKILDRLTVSTEEKALVALYQDAQTLSKLFSLELTERDYAAAIKRKAELEPSVLKEKLSKFFNQIKPAQPNMTELFKRALSFYDVARQREAVIFENMISKMKSLNETNVVLITGGFHAAGFSELFEENNISYARISPRINEIEDTDSYLDAMLLEGDYKTLRSNAKQLTHAISMMELPKGLDHAIAAKTARRLGEESPEGIEAGLDNEVHGFETRNLLDGAIAMVLEGKPVTVRGGALVYKQGRFHTASAAQVTKQLAFKRSEAREYKKFAKVYDPSTNKIVISANPEPSGRFGRDLGTRKTIWRHDDGSVDENVVYRAKDPEDITHHVLQPWSFYLDQVVSKMKSEGINYFDADILSLNNLYSNGWNTIYDGEAGELFHQLHEPFEKRTYHMFVVWEDGHVSSEDLNFVQRQDEKTGRVEVYRAEDALKETDLTGKIRYAFFGQRVLSKGKAADLVEVAKRTSDLFHLFRFPQFVDKGTNDDNRDRYGPHFGFDELQNMIDDDDTDSIRNLFETNGYLRIDLRQYTEKVAEAGFSLADIEEKALRAQGYKPYSTSFARSGSTHPDDFEVGTYYVEGDTLHVKLRPFPYPHNMVGITKSGKVVPMVFTGNKNQEIGVTIQELPEQIQALYREQVGAAADEDPIWDVHLGSNSKDASVYHGDETGQASATEIASDKPYETVKAMIFFVAPRGNQELQSKKTTRSEARTKHQLTFNKRKGEIDERPVGHGSTDGFVIAGKYLLFITSTPGYVTVENRGASNTVSIALERVHSFEVEDFTPSEAALRSIGTGSLGSTFSLGDDSLKISWGGLPSGNAKTETVTLTVETATPVSVMRIHESEYEKYIQAQTAVTYDETQAVVGVRSEARTLEKAIAGYGFDRAVIDEVFRLANETASPKLHDVMSEYLTSVLGPELSDEAMLAIEREGAQHAIDVMRTAVGEEFAWLFNTGNANENVEMTIPVQGMPTARDLSGVIANHLTSPTDEINVVLQGASKDQAESLKVQLITRALKANVHSSIAKRLNVVAVDESKSQLVRTLQKIVGSNNPRVSEQALISAKKNLLEKVGHRGARLILSPEQLDQNTAITITAVMLRDQVEADGYSIEEIREWANAKGIDLNLLVQRIAQALKALDAIMTSA